VPLEHLGYGRNGRSATALYEKAGISRWVRTLTSQPGTIVHSSRTFHLPGLGSSVIEKMRKNIPSAVFFVPVGVRWAMLNPSRSRIPLPLSTPLLLSLVQIGLLPAGNYKGAGWYHHSMTHRLRTEMLIGLASYGIDYAPLFAVAGLAIYFALHRRNNLRNIPGPPSSSWTFGRDLPIHAFCAESDIYFLQEICCNCCSHSSTATTNSLG
jgi:hypothetical protein